jgi:phospholipid transport system transporter-binding protein
MYPVPGPITMANASAVLSGGAEAMESREEQFSLAALAGSDSSALAVLLSWQRRAVRQSLALRFIDVPESIVNFATLYGIEGFLPGFPGASPGAPVVPAGPRADSPTHR